LNQFIVANADGTTIHAFVRYPLCDNGFPGTLELLTFIILNRAALRFVITLTIPDPTFGYRMAERQINPWADLADRLGNLMMPVMLCCATHD
tara:strand:+ start:293 stop:568 length:276 start_codon:yes stop_codon:yes gene_type:complete